MPPCDSNIRFVCFRAKGARPARVHFPDTYFFVLCSPIFSNSFLFLFENIMTEKKTLDAKTFSCVTAQAYLLRFTGLSAKITDKKMEKSEFFGGEIVTEK